MEPTVQAEEVQDTQENLGPPPLNYQRKRGNNAFQLILKSLIIEENPAHRKDALYNLNDLIDDEKPTFRQLEAILMSIIKAEQKSPTRETEGNFLKSIVFQLLSVHEIARQMRLGSIICNLGLKVNRTIKEAYPEHFNQKEINQIGLDFWKKIDGTNLEEYLNIFNIQDTINPQELIPKINEKLKAQRFEEAGYYIATLKLHKHFNVEDLVYDLAASKYCGSINQLVRDYPNLQKLAIKELLNNKNTQKAADLVKDFKLDPAHFPPLLETLEKAALRYHIGQGTWMSLEEKFCDIPRLLGYYLEELIDKKEFDKAVSIIKRQNKHKFLEGNYIRKAKLERIAPYLSEPPKKPFIYLTNDIFEFDAFGPTEEALGEASTGTYWHARDFGLDPEKDIILIDNCETEVFEKARKDILGSSAIGLDSEFRFSTSKFDAHGMDLLQLANYKKIYLFDAFKLSGNPKYNKLVDDLLSNPKILKVGHSLSSDLHKLKETKDNEEPTVVKAEVDIASIYRTLFSSSRYALSFICEHILKKPMSKFEQVSNWQHRPLRKAQLHYAALDAYIVLKIFDELRGELASRGGEIEEFMNGYEGPDLQIVAKTAPVKQAKEPQGESEEFKALSLEASKLIAQKEESKAQSDKQLGAKEIVEWSQMEQKAQGAGWSTLGDGKKTEVKKNVSEKPKKDELDSLKMNFAVKVEKKKKKKNTQDEE